MEIHPTKLRKVKVKHKGIPEQYLSIEANNISETPFSIIDIIYKKNHIVVEYVKTDDMIKFTCRKNIKVKKQYLRSLENQPTK